MMKRITVLLAAIMMAGFANAQSDVIDRLIDKYGGNEGVTVVNISPELFQIIDGLEIEDIKSDEFPVDKLSAVKILSIENEKILAENNFFDEVTGGFNNSEFVEVMTVKDGDEDVKMWMKTEGKQILDFLLVVSSPGEGVVVYVKGDFSINDINGLAESFGMKSIETEIETEN